MACAARVDQAVCVAAGSPTCPADRLAGAGLAIQLPRSRPSGAGLSTPQGGRVANELGAGGLRLERDGALAWLTIDRPHARNAFTPAMYFGIKKAVHLVNADPE